MPGLQLRELSARPDPFSADSECFALEAQSEEGQKVREAARQAGRRRQDCVGHLFSEADTANPENMEGRFRELAEQWRRETGMYSSISQKVRHPAYRNIIALGEKALPLILRELRDRPAHWFSALKAIAHKGPLPHRDHANPKKAREAWLKWGQERGLIE